MKSDAEGVAAELRAPPGKDFAIFGGAFRSCPTAGRAILKLRQQRPYEKTGIIGLEYDIVRREARS